MSEFNCQKVFPYIGFKGTNKGKHVNAKNAEKNQKMQSTDVCVFIMPQNNPDQKIYVYLGLKTYM